MLCPVDHPKSLCHGSISKSLWIRFFLMNLSLFCLTSCITGGAQPMVEQVTVADQHLPTHYYWTTLGPEGTLILRTLVKDAPCPEVAIDGQKHPMARRAESTSEFPVGVCETFIKKEARDVRLGQERVALVPKNLRKIVILGDTGCRLKKTPGGIVFQACLDPNAWPFPAIAKAAAKENPDLVIHLGDYHYREAPCPEGASGCQNTPYGDNWQVWNADFFAPAAPLLPKAPWIFVRGNHELCSRAGHGWTYLLDPRPYRRNCLDQTPPYTLTLGNHLIAVLDSADDKNAQPSLDHIYPSKELLLWILTHRPFLTPTPAGEAPDAKVELPSQLRGLGKVSAIFTGHRHFMSLNQFRDHRPPELILGNSGTSLDNPDFDDRPSGAPGKKYSKTVYDGFGYLTMKNAGANSWVLVEHDRDGEPVIRCVLQESEGHKTVLNCDTHAYDGQ